MNNCTWEHFEHKADIGVRGIAPTISQAFEQTALALTAVMTDLHCITPQTDVIIECDAPDYELLLVEWLNNVIYEIATRKIIFCKYSVSINNHHLSAVASGESIDVQKHQPAVEIKGATYTELKVTQQSNNMWLAQCVVDV